MARRSSRANKTKRSVDFSQEVKWFDPDMEYEVEVKACTWEEGTDHPYLAIVFKGTDDDMEEAELYHNASVSPKALHRTRVVLEALGLEINSGEPMDIDSDDLVGLRCMLHTYEDEYRGADGEKKKNVKADDFWPVDDKTSKKDKKSKKDDDDDKSSKRGGKGKSKKDEPELADKSEVEALEDRDEMIELIEKYDLDVDADDRKLKKDDKLLAAIIDEMEEKELFEEEEEEKPAKSRRGKKDEEDEPKGKAGRSKRGSGKSNKKSETWSEDDIQDMSEEELDEVIEKAELELDLSEHRTLRKKKNALIDALEEAELLDK